MLPVLSYYHWKIYRLQCQNIHETKTIGQFGFFPMTLQGDFSSKEMSQETSDIAQAVTAIPPGPSNQYLASVKAILIKFTRHEMESPGEKSWVFTKWNKWAIFVDAGVFGNAKATEKPLISPEHILFEVEILFTVKCRTLLISLKKWDNEGTNCYFTLSHWDVKCWCLSTSQDLILCSVGLWMITGGFP